MHLLLILLLLGGDQGDLIDVGLDARRFGVVGEDVTSSFFNYDTSDPLLQSVRSE